MDLRRAAEGLAEEVDTAADWIEACPFQNAIPHSEKLRKRADMIREALSQPDMLAEAVDLIRQSAHMGCLCDFVHGCESCKLVAKCWNFVRRYDAAQQEQNDA